MEASGPCKTLWIGDIQPHWDETFLNSLFADYGTLTEIKLIRDKLTGYPSGYGFVEFETRELAEKALDELNGHPIAGTPYRYRLNWGAGGRRVEGPPEFSVFVGDLGAEVTDVMLQQLFSAQFPSTIAAKVVVDPANGMSKGFGFVRFGSEEDKDQALAQMTGAVCGSRPIRVAPATAKRNPPGSVVTQGSPTAMELEDMSNTTVFVGGLCNTVTEEQLREEFGTFGEIVYVKIPPNRGCGFVQFVKRSTAEAAITKMQGAEIGGSKAGMMVPPVGAVGMYGGYYPPYPMRQGQGFRAAGAGLTPISSQHAYYGMPMSPNPPPYSPTGYQQPYSPPPGQPYMPVGSYNFAGYAPSYGPYSPTAMMDPERAAASSTSRASPYGIPTSPFSFDRANMLPDQGQRSLRGGAGAPMGGGEMCDLSPDSVPFYPAKIAPAGGYQAGMMYPR